MLSAQSIADLIEEVDTNSLNLYLNEFAGEVSTTVKGETVTIINRESNSPNGNDLAADYLAERLNSFGNLIVNDTPYRKGGRNVVATQLGQTNPENIYIVCAHYDSVADYCADDNATSASAILEIARVLSQYCIDNTIIYAFWDEEEVGFVGSYFYANDARGNGDNILGVINLEMLGYDKNQNDDASIHARDIANSVGIQTSVIDVLNTYSSEIGLTANPVNPGLGSSDHTNFWDKNYSAIVISEAEVFDDLTPFYHSADDRVATLDLPYFHKMSKLAMATVANFAGVVDSGNCNTLSISDSNLEDGMTFNNPITNSINISLTNFTNSSVEVLSMQGQVVKKEQLKHKRTNINLENLTKGIYLMKVTSENKVVIKKIIKE